jgi:hypothetical protein
MLDLGGERQRDRAFAPLEQVGEPPIGDDHVRQRVRGERDVGHRPLVRWSREHELDQTDRLAAVGDRREQARVVVAAFDDDDLLGQRAAVGGVHQRDALGGLAALGSRGRSGAGVAEPDERSPAEVRDQERHLRRAERVSQALTEDVRRRDRRRVLDGRE